MSEKLDKYILDIQIDNETGEEHCTVLKTDGTTNMDDWITIISAIYTHHSVFEPLIKELNKLSEENEQLQKDATTLIYTNQDYRHKNEQLKKELKIYRKIATCSNCKYQNYDWFDDGDEFEVCEKGNNEAQIENHSCSEWEEM